MEVRAVSKWVRTGPRKIRKYTDLIRGRKLADVDGAFDMPRLRPRARGRADRIRKFSCHVTVVLSDGE